MDHKIVRKSHPLFDNNYQSVMTLETLQQKAIRLTGFLFARITESETDKAVVETAGSVKLNREIERASANQGLPLIVKYEGGRIYARVKRTDQSLKGFPVCPHYDYVNRDCVL